MAMAAMIEVVQQFRGNPIIGQKRVLAISKNSYVHLVYFDPNTSVLLN